MKSTGNLLHGFSVLAIHPTGSPQFFLDKDMLQYHIPVDGKTLVNDKEWVTKRILGPAYHVYPNWELKLVRVDVTYTCSDPGDSNYAA